MKIYVVYVKCEWANGFLKENSHISFNPSGSSLLFFKEHGYQSVCKYVAYIPDEDMCFLKLRNDKNVLITPMENISKFEIENTW